MNDAASALLLGLGTAFILIGAWGIVRLPDIYCRAHALTKAMTFGVMLMLGGLWLRLEGDDVGLKIALAVVFQFITIPVAGHILSLLAYRSGIPPFRSGDGPAS